MIQIPPEDAVSNSAKWLKSAGIPYPTWLDARNTDVIVHWIFLCIVIGIAGRIFWKYICPYYKDTSLSLRIVATISVCFLTYFFTSVLPIRVASPNSYPSPKSPSTVTGKAGPQVPETYRNHLPEKAGESEDKSVLSVWRTTLVRDEAAHKLRINLELMNSGNFGTSAHITFRLYDNSVLATAVNSVIPDRLYFAPHQTVNLDLPLNMTKEGYMAYVTGTHTYEVLIEAEYENGNNLVTYLFKGRLNPETTEINTVQSEMKKSR